MTYGQVFILVKGDPWVGKCIMWTGQQQPWPKGKSTAEGGLFLRYYGWLRWWPRQAQPRCQAPGYLQPELIPLPLSACFRCSQLVHELWTKQKKKKKEAAVWNERRAQMRWAQTERKCCWKGKRWEEEKHRRLLISSLVLFLCYVCFMFPSADWRDYRLRRSYVQVPLMWPSSIYFIGDSFLSLFSSQEKRRWSVFAALSQTLLHKWLQHITPSFHQSNSLCSVLLGAGLLQSSFFFFPLQFPLKSSHEKLIGSHYY